MSRYTSDDRFDFNRLLDWKKAQVIQGGASGLQPDETFTLTWQIPYGAHEQAREWVYAYRQGVEAPELPFMQLSGFWRTVQVRSSVVDPKNSNAGVIFEQVIAKGYYTSIDWDSARVIAGERSDSNTTSAQIDKTQSATTQSTIQVRLPYIAPEFINSILSETTFPDPLVIRGNNYGTLKRIISSARLEDDGSYSVIFTLSDPQYTIKSYDNAGGTNEQDIVYLWSVPKDYAQDIIDSWKTQNPISASATANYNDSAKLVDIILRKNALIKPNLSLGGIRVACDTTQNFHFAWGYEKADIQAFIDAHNSPTGTGSRQVQVQSRSDGLYDITIIETVVSASSPPHFITTVKVGTAISSAQHYGWNISIFQLEAIKSTFSTAQKGVVTQFRVTREDNCTFDYEASITTSLEQSKTLTINSDETNNSGIVTVAKSIRSSTADNSSFGFTGGARKRHRVQVDANEDGTTNATIVEETVRKIDHKVEVKGDGITENYQSFSNVLKDEIPDIEESGPRKRVQATIRGNDDGTFNGEIQTVQVKKSSDSASSGPITYKYGGNEEESLQKQIGSNQVIASFSASVKDDTTKDYTIQLKNLNSPVHQQASYGEPGGNIEVIAEVGGLQGNVQNEVSSLSDGQIANVTLRPLDDGSYGYSVEKITANPLNVQIIESGTIINKLVDKTFVNIKSDELETYFEPLTDGQTRNATVTINERSGRVSGKVQTETANQSITVIDTEDDGVIKKTIERVINIPSQKNLEADERGRTSHEILENNRLRSIKETLTMSPSLASVSETSTIAKNEYDWYTSTVQAEGLGVRWLAVTRANETRETKVYQARAYRKRTVTTTITTTYSLNAPTNLDKPETPSDEGEKEITVKLTGFGLWTKTDRTVNIGEWGALNIFGWEDFANGNVKVITTTDELSGNATIQFSP